MKSATEEIRRYRYNALEASATGDRALAKQWRMAADQAYNFYLQHQWKESVSLSVQEKVDRPVICDDVCTLAGADPIAQHHLSVPIQSSEQIDHNNKFIFRSPRALSMNYQVLAVRQEVRSVLQASQALEGQHKELAQKLVTTALSIREAADRYHDWITYAKQEFDQSSPNKITSSHETVESYRLKAFEAQETHHVEVAQQWAEAACLLQEAIRKLKMAQKTAGNRLRPLLTDYWRAAASVAYHASSFQAHAALHEKVLASEWRKAALWADDAMVFKAKAARIHQTNEFHSIDWSLAGYWMALASDIKVFLIKKFSQKIKLPSWEKAFTAVENVAHVYQQALPCLEDKNSSPYWLDLIASSEDAADRFIILAENELE